MNDEPACLSCALTGETCNLSGEAPDGRCPEHSAPVLRQSVAQLHGNWPHTGLRNQQPPPDVHCTSLCAPKKRIGGSGSLATGGSYDYLSRQLAATGEVLVAFARGFLGLVFLAIWALLVDRLPGKHSGFGRTLRMPAKGAPLRILLGLTGTAVNMAPPLCWKATRKRRGTPGMKCSRPPLRSFIPLLAAISFGHVPVCVWAAQPQLQQVMQEVDRILLTSPEPLQSQVPHFDSAGRETSLDDTRVCRLPLRPGEALPAVEHRWLGVTVFAPGYQPSCFALSCRSGASQATVTEQVLAVEASSRPGLSGISPVLQQRHNGYAAFILHSLEDSRIDQAAVIIDLSRVGGHYYASTQPACLQVESFLASILRQTGVDDRDLCLWTQDSDLRPSPPEATLRLRHGDVLTVLWQGVQPAPTYQIEDLFCPDAIWGPVWHMPIRTYSQPGCLVLHPPEVFVLHRHHFPGCDFHEALRAALRQPTEALYILSAELPDPVEHCGELCNRAVLIARISGVDDSGTIKGNPQEV